MAEQSKNIDIKFFGQNLRKAREAKKLSMQQLANVAEIEKSQIARIEIGRSDPRLSTILVIAKALELDAVELLKKNL
ncbi:helix-turn-helix domain-containing protein [Mucilaginibacter sp.]|uniref:helix-turn-helix domain-containing protein n=1 Tax=Mucilaginibacter sp. TaxID=1882438 RepID=UPI0035BBFEB5